MLFRSISAALEGNANDLVSLIESPPLAVEMLKGRNTGLEAARLASRAALKNANLWNVSDSTVSTYFGGIYFSFAQAALLDATLAFGASVEPTLRDTIVAAALSAASSVVNTVGKQFAQPIRPRDKSGAIKKNIGSTVSRDRALDAGRIYREWLGKYASIPKATYKHDALRLSYQEALSRQGTEFSVVYADPPYTRDHYSRFYHVLETMCLRDSPEISPVARNGYKGPSRGAYRADRHQSPFCIRSEAPRALDELCEKTRQLGLALVLSYSPHESGDGTHPRVMSASDIVRIANRSYSKVDVQLLDGSTHNQLNRSELGLAKRLHAEMIIECRP